MLTTYFGGDHLMLSNCIVLHRISWGFSPTNLRYRFGKKGASRERSSQHGFHDPETEITMEVWNFDRALFYPRAAPRSIQRLLWLRYIPQGWKWSDTINLHTVHPRGTPTHYHKASKGTEKNLRSTGWGGTASDGGRTDPDGGDSLLRFRDFRKINFLQFFENFKRPTPKIL